MQLTRLKYWRELRGLSVRELAEAAGVAYPTVSLLENLKRPAQGRTARKLAQALGVKFTELYTEDQQTLQPINDNKIITFAKPARPRTNKKQMAVSFWVFENQEDGEPFRADTQAEAERLQSRLGEQHQARVYKAAKKAEAWELHLKFLKAVARGHDTW